MIFVCVLFSFQCRAAGIPVLMYHQITNDSPAGATVISPALFKEEMQFLHDGGYTTLSVDELVDIMNSKKLAPNKAIVITFDDGFTSVLNAVPVLNSYEMKATFNIITGTLGGQYGSSYLTLNQLKSLVVNPRFVVESHTVTHPDDPTNNLVAWIEGKTQNRNELDVKNEIINSKLTLSLLGKAVDSIAWPSGYYNQQILDFAKYAGYKSAMMAWGDGGNSPGDDPFQIKRVLVSGKCNITQFEQMVITNSDNEPCDN